MSVESVYMRAQVQQTKNKRPGLIAYAVLFALALFQLGFAVHQGEHAASDIAETCSICAHYDQHDDVPFVADAAAPIEPAMRSALPAEALLPGRATCTFFQSRAPPTI